MQDSQRLQSHTGALPELQVRANWIRNQRRLVRAERLGSIQARRRWSATSQSWLANQTLRLVMSAIKTRNKFILSLWLVPGIYSISSTLIGNRRKQQTEKFEKRLRSLPESISQFSALPAKELFLETIIAKRWAICITATSIIRLICYRNGH